MYSFIKSTMTHNKNQKTMLILSKCCIYIMDIYSQTDDVDDYTIDRVKLSPLLPLFA